MSAYNLFSDQELTLLLKEDDRLAFEEIYRRYWPELLDTAWKRLSDTETAEELLQDVFISLYTSRHSLVIHTSLIAYLKNALKYKVLNEIRSRIVRANYNQRVMRLNEGKVGPQPHEILEARELERIIDEKINQLPEKCREVFILSRKEHLSHQHIADRLGISVSTVEKHIGKALRIVRTHLDDVQIITLIYIAHFLK
ncbi:RNA polymerase sigma-70 factor [Pedobacter sp. BG31]|uniref:RNA polymerase sigma-70 factor n=1 Tax=Pedobacter sp. BG31 TaxID=3349697 RepID=UPI0035F40B4D